MAFVDTEKPKIKPAVSNLSTGRAYVFAGFNNTIVTLTDNDGRPVSVGSSGAAGFKGSRKSTPYAATMATTNAAKKAYQKGLREVSVFVKGPGAGRLAAVKALKAAGINVVSIADVTPIPHNGCRAANRRRV